MNNPPLNTIFVGTEVFRNILKSAELCSTANKPKGIESYFLNGVEFRESEYLEPTALMTFDPNLIAIIKELEENKNDTTNTE